MWGRCCALLSRVSRVGRICECELVCRTEFPEKFSDTARVLVSKDFCGGHEDCLVAVIDGLQHTEKGHNGFAGAYFTLKETVHGVGLTNVCRDFGKYFFLPSGEAVGQSLLQGGNKALAVWWAGWRLMGVTFLLLL